MEAVDIHERDLAAIEPLAKNRLIRKALFQEDDSGSQDCQLLRADFECSIRDK